MTGWEGEARWDHDVLQRIVALLFALADLADRAAGVSARRRREVLGILMVGEAEARAFVIGMVCDDSVPADGLEQIGDAARLAVRFRALALMLCVLLTRAAPFARCGAIGLRAGQEGPAGRAGRHAALPAPDTS